MRLIVHACIVLAFAVLGTSTRLPEQRFREKVNSRSLDNYDWHNLTMIQRVKGKETNNNVPVSPTIIGGEQANPGQFPWQAALTLDSRYFCGGSLISSQWVMTAAHCTRDFYEFMIYLGITDLDDEENRLVYFTSCSVVHEEYNGIHLNNDIALIKLPDKVPQEAFATGNVGTICLPTAQQAMELSFVDEQVVASGWGLIDDLQRSPLLMHTTLTVMSNKECAEFYWEEERLVIHNTLCTYPSESTSVCFGDSGGALVWTDPDGKSVQIGITSFASSGTCLGGPNGFTRVTGYIYWIHKHTGIHIKGMSHSIPSDTSSDSSGHHSHHRMDTLRHSQGNE